ncbi:hypothetical protein [Streptomyces kaniharaensis]|uniref:hypothetical protein n=1 Tax=Streptomyces kaniharaensis TaxID=212423 RepID=UPI001297129C|nr:hypothetical protein [Streptomyces kaniharaensis]
MRGIISAFVAAFAVVAVCGAVATTSTVNSAAPTGPLGVKLPTVVAYDTAWGS